MIWLNFLIGGLVVPLLLFGAAVLLDNYRKKNGLGEIPPNQLSLILILLTLISWGIAGFNILINLLRN